ncbi:hypothetical protein INT43_008328, partial [Umbelopsis isabellina]
MHFTNILLSASLVVAGLFASHAEACITAETDLDGRSAPKSSASRTTNVYKTGACINVKCQTTGDTLYGTNIWDYDGKYYLPDAYVKTGYSSFDPNIPRCSTSGGGGSGGGCGGHMNQVGLTFLEQHEGWSATIYNDGAGHPTIGYGHNCDADSQHCKQLSPPITKAEGQKLLQQDLAGFEKTVCNAVKTQNCPLNCNQFNALVSFTYNVGSGGFLGSKIYEHMANRDYQGIYNLFPQEYLNGGTLLSRRKAEAALFNTATSTSSG